MAAQHKQSNKKLLTLVYGPKAAGSFILEQPLLTIDMFCAGRGCECFTFHTFISLTATDLLFVTQL